MPSIRDYFIMSDPANAQRLAREEERQVMEARVLKRMTDRQTHSDQVNQHMESPIGGPIGFSSAPGCLVRRADSGAGFSAKRPRRDAEHPPKEEEEECTTPTRRIGKRMMPKDPTRRIGKRMMPKDEWEKQVRLAKEAYDKYGPGSARCSSDADRGSEGLSG